MANVFSEVPYGVQRERKRGREREGGKYHDLLQSFVHLYAVMELTGVKLYRLLFIYKLLSFLK